MIDWRERSADPNDASALEQRRRQMAEVSRRSVPDRVSWMQDICRGRKVLDVGCVDHDAARMAESQWLHRKLVEVSEECLGVDYEPEGIRRLVDAGYSAVCVDITAGLGPVAETAPFDVVVAGEVIEHLSSPQSLLSFAAEALRPGGVLAITTPNPYAPWRVRAGHLGQVWENADHVAYMFPAGIAEMANRTGLRLTEFATTDLPWTRRPTRSLRAGVLALLLRLRGVTPDRPQGRLRLPVHPRYMTVVDVLTIGYRRAEAATGETALYLLKKPADPSPARPH